MRSREREYAEEVRSGVGEGRSQKSAAAGLWLQRQQDGDNSMLSKAWHPSLDVNGRLNINGSTGTSMASGKVSQWYVPLDPIAAAEAASRTTGRKKERRSRRQRRESAHHRTDRDSDAR